ncbi:hypothetical protein C1T17_20830 (plasmid) [Sphingobium sp. SCG-1]|uniref:transposase n=1 Tax=Sphingobium sp. SCG-1 TaxID=2072936 RepID=UPI000CD6946E|nr:transposase [Sphingobium sp. SCG-1]AUW60649.1 hypothetical protein C1T17_20830 [Sphingobium sp. SCG-1]
MDQEGGGGVARRIDRAPTRIGNDTVGPLSHFDLTDIEWHSVKEALPPERGRQSRPAHDNRRFADGILFVVGTGCPWRHMPSRYGKWNSVYFRFIRWKRQGVWDRLYAVLVDLGMPARWPCNVDAMSLDLSRSSIRLSSRAAVRTEQMRGTEMTRSTLERGAPDQDCSKSWGRAGRFEGRESHAALPGDHGENVRPITGKTSSHSTRNGSVF